MRIFTLKHLAAIAAAASITAATAQTTFVQNKLLYTVLNDSAKTVKVQHNDIEQADVVIPETVTNEGVTYTVTETAERGFEKMKNLHSIDIPKTIVRFGKHTFNESTIEITNIHDINAWVKIDFNSTSLANPIYRSENLYLDGKVLEEAIITDPITEIPTLAFYFCKTLKKVVLPPTVKTIGKWGFYKSGIEEIQLSDSLTTSLDYAFQYCHNLKSVVMPDNYTNLKGSTFVECMAVKYIKIAKNLKSLPLNTFQKCNSLETIEWGDSLQTIGKGAFAANVMKKLELPNSLIKITNQAFIDSKDLEEITIGPNVNFIGYLAFYVQDETIKLFDWKCPMRKITCEAVVPPTMEMTKDKNGVDYNMAWNDEVYDQAVLYVPTESVEAYKAAPEWNRFKNIAAIGSTSVAEIAAPAVKIAKEGNAIVVAGAENPLVEVFDITGRKLYQGNTNSVNMPAGGIYIVRCLGVSAKIAL